MTRRPKGTKKSQLFGRTVQVCVTEEELEVLDIIKKREERSRSDVVREVLAPVLRREITALRRAARGEVDDHEAGDPAPPA